MVYEQFLDLQNTIVELPSAMPCAIVIKAWLCINFTAENMCIF